MPYYLASCYILLSQVVICCFDTQACCLFLHFLACWCFMSFSLASYLIMWSYITVHLQVSDCIMLHIYIYIYSSLSLSLPCLQCPCRPCTDAILGSFPNTCSALSSANAWVCTASCHNHVLLFVHKTLKPAL